jgi:hypothetical protein
MMNSHGPQSLRAIDSVVHAFRVSPLLTITQSVEEFFDVTIRNSAYTFYCYHLRK